MPHLSSTDRLIMAANGMTNALQSPHPDVPFTQVGDDTISALTALAKIFKLKLQKVQTPALPAAPPKVVLRPCLAESSNPILASPMSLPRQTRSQTTIYARDIAKAPLLPRVVTPMTRTSLTEYFSPQLVLRRLLRHGHFPHGHSPRESPLVPVAPIQYSCSPRHLKGSGIHGTYERPPSTTTLETRFPKRQ
jgi:hypothetical protein